MNTKVAYQVRSISLPSASHPVIINAEELLSTGEVENLKSSECISSSSSICRKLDGLVHLFDSVDDVLQLPLGQQAHGKRVEKVWDGYLRLLDLCGTVRDAFSQMKESVQQLESSLRRRRGGNYGLSNEVGAYMLSHKKLNKLICKSFEDLKKMEKSCITRSLEKDSHLVAVVTLLGEIEGISLTVFDSLLSFVSQPKARSKI